MKNEKRVYTFGNGQAEGRADIGKGLGGKWAKLGAMKQIQGTVSTGGIS